MVHVGHDNYVSSEIIAAILTPDGAPSRRLRKSAEDNGTMINATAGHKARSLIVLTTNQVVLSALQTSTLKERVDKTKRLMKFGEMD